jgi:hypothetical protein
MSNSESQAKDYTIEVTEIDVLADLQDHTQYSVNFIGPGASRENSDRQDATWTSQFFKIGREDARVVIDVYTPNGEDLPQRYKNNIMLELVIQEVRRRFSSKSDTASSLGSTQSPPPSASSAGATTATDATQ